MASLEEAGQSVRQVAARNLKCIHDLLSFPILSARFREL